MKKSNKEEQGEDHVEDETDKPTGEEELKCYAARYCVTLRGTDTFDLARFPAEIK